MQHSFDVDIAKEQGVLEAILLNNLWFWIEKNRANNVNFYDGSYWTYNSTKAFTELFPYVTQRQIQNALKKLKDRGIIKTGNYNKSAYDRTLWYAFTKKGISIMQKCKMEDADLLNGNTDNVEPIPDNKPDSKPNNNKKERKNESQYDIIINELVSDYDIKEALIEFIKMRKLIKKPMTDRALRQLITKLFSLSTNKEEQLQILDNSIINNWSSIYPLKKENNNKAFKRTEIVPDWLNQQNDINIPTAEESAEIDDILNDITAFSERKEALREKLRNKYGKNASNS